MNILIIENDQVAASAIALTLKGAKHQCSIECTFEDGLRSAAKGNFDAIILDINLPDGNGVQLIQILRRNKVNTSILVLSGIDDISNRIDALNAGADGFLAKPYDSGELLANMNAIIRRSHGYGDNFIATGAIIVDINKREATVNGKSLKLTAKEYSILELMSLKKGIILTKAHFIDYLYGGIDEPEFKVIDVFICKLRKKIDDIIGANNDVKYIHTLWGQGYVLRDPDDLSASETKRKNA